MSCPYCHHGRIAVEGGRSYHCPDCEVRELSREETDAAWHAENDPLPAITAELRDGRILTVLDADGEDAPDFQVQLGAETFSRMEAYDAKAPDGTELFCGWEWQAILDAVDRYNAQQKGVAA